jgi:hypothetical protein
VFAPLWANLPGVDFDTLRIVTAKNDLTIRDMFILKMTKWCLFGWFFRFTTRISKTFGYLREFEYLPEYLNVLDTFLGIVYDLRKKIDKSIKYIYTNVNNN